MNAREAGILSLSLLFCWLSGILAVGLLASAVSEPGLFSLVNIALVLIALWPCLFIYRNIDGLEGAVRDYLDGREIPVAVTAVLFVASFLSFRLDISNPVLAVLNLPFHSTNTVLYPVQVFYRQLGERLSWLVYEFGRWYVELVWIFILADTGYSLVTSGLKTDGDQG